MDSAGAPFQQSWTYGEAARRAGARVLRLDLRAEGRTIALAQGITRRFVFPVTLFSMGPVWIGEPSADARASALRLLRKSGRGLVICTPSDKLGNASLEASGFTDVMTPGTFAVMDLGKGLRGRMQGKWRNRLAAAERKGFEVHAVKNDAAFQRLYTHDQAQRKKRGYRALLVAFTEHWCSVAPESVMLLTAGKASDPMAAMLFLRHGSSATYHIGWTSDEGRTCHAHNLLLYRAGKKLATKGVTRLNLGLIDTETAPGLARFKLGSGARPVKTGGTWLGW